MAIVDSTTLHYQDGRSDKVYHAYIERGIGGTFAVVALYGRRGQSLQETRKGDGLSQFAAQSKFDKLVQEKRGKGYDPVAPGTVGIPANVIASAGAPNAAAPNPTPAPNPAPKTNDTGLRPQLLNPITEDDAGKYIDDPAYGLQEKKNGVRLMVRKDGLTLTAANRSGNAVTIGADLEAALMALGGSFVLDGELVDGTYHVFDVLEDFGRELRQRPYRERYDALVKLLIGSREAVQLVPLYVDAEEKRAAFEGFRSGKREGVVFKRLDAIATEGRPSSGGPQLKCKFWVTASAIVAQHNEKRSIGLEMFEQREAAVKCGCTGNHAAADLKGCDRWVCRCGNAPERSGFTPCDVFGSPVDGIESGIVRCEECGIVLDAGGRELVRSSVGNVTVKPKQKTPQRGAIVEIKYLHIVGFGGHLVQPELLGERHDIPATDCVLSQLKVECGPV